MYGRHLGVCRPERCISSISAAKSAKRAYSLQSERQTTYREDTNALQTSNVFVEILCVGSNIMTRGDGCFQHIFSRPVLEVGAVRDVDRPIVAMEGLVYLRIFQVVVLKLTFVSDSSRSKH